MTEEQELRAQLAEIYRQHQKACEPIIRRLAAIHARKTPRLIINTMANEVMNYDQWAELQENEVLK